MTLCYFSFYTGLQRVTEDRTSVSRCDIFAERRQRGSYSTLVQEMRLGDAQSHLRYFRMSKEKFDDLLHKVRQ